MSTSHITAWWRAFGKPLMSAALVLMLAFSALASTSPSLHHWLHGDHQAPSHYCVLTALEHGNCDVPTAWLPAPLPATQFAVAALPCESFFVSHDLKLFPERGPPLLS